VNFPNYVSMTTIIYQDLMRNFLVQCLVPDIMEQLETVADSKIQ